jgi:hypothetical protein
MSILTGRVEIDARVVSQSLDLMELNFWDGMTITDIHRSDSPQERLSYASEQDI